MFNEVNQYINYSCREMVIAFSKQTFNQNGFIEMARNNLPAENTKNQIQHKKRSKYNQRHEVDPIV